MPLTINKRRSKTVKNGVVDCKLKTVSSGFDLHMSLVMRKPENRIFAYAKTKTQISFAVTPKLISTFVFATWIVQFLYYLNPKFQASCLFCGCTARFVWDLVRNPEEPVFSQRGSYDDCMHRLFDYHVCGMIKYRLY